MALVGPPRNHENGAAAKAIFTPDNRMVDGSRGTRKGLVESSCGLALGNDRVEFVLFVADRVGVDIPDDGLLAFLISYGDYLCVHVPVAPDQAHLLKIVGYEMDGVFEVKSLKRPGAREEQNQTAGVVISPGVAHGVQVSGNPQVFPALVSLECRLHVEAAIAARGE